VKLRAVLKAIKQGAKRAGVPFHMTELTNHTGRTVGHIRTTLARHSEISEGTAEALYRQIEPALGKGWWRR
jgi:hypothetical protein